MSDKCRLFRGNILHFSQTTRDPNFYTDYFHDGALVIEGSRIVAIGYYRILKEQYNTSTEYDYSGKLIIPGLIDSHLHIPQTEMIAKYGEQLLAWLETYTFPTENKFEYPNFYALTPRFAPTSTDKQLHLLGELAQHYSSVFMQTHLSENHGEIEWVKHLFPQHNTYLDVYDHYNMVHSQALFGHCLHLHEQEWERLAEAGASTSFNMLRTYGDAYKVGQLQQFPVSALQGLYMMTQGPASACGLDSEIGNLNPSTYADFVILNPHFDAIGKLRFDSLCNTDKAQVQSENECQALSEDMLFALSFIGDDRAVEATYVGGKNIKQQLKEQRYALA